MKNRIASILACLLLPVLLLAAGFGIAPCYEQTYLGAFSHKIHAMKTAQGPRILIAGGSGAAFALRCDLLEQALPGYRAVNLGMYAGLGSAVSLEAAVSGAGEGDIVVFLPEQNRQTLSLYVGGEAMWQAADGHWELLALTPPGGIAKLIAQYPYFAGAKAGFLMNGSYPEGDGIYRRSAFNPWGDIDSALRACNIMAGGYDLGTGVDFSEELPTRDMLDYINDCTRRCQKAGAKLYVTGCPINALAVPKGSEAAQAAYLQRLSTQLHCGLLGGAALCILDSGWFYDTNFHLNSAGAVVYTIRLAELLKAELGMDGETGIELPQMPEPAAQLANEGDCSDADCFLFAFDERTASAWVEGLSEAGKDAQTLTVPTHVRGMQVVGIAANAFAGNETLCQIVLQPGIRWLEDGAFRGCSRLASVVLAGISPSSCSVGSGLLDGCAARILVDGSRLGAYRANYFWSVLAERIETFEPAAQEPVPTQTTPVQMGSGIAYAPNGAPWQAQAVEMDPKQLRQNTLPWSQDLSRPGYTLYGWNTAPDGSGISLALGGRGDLPGGSTLFAQWAEQTAEHCFLWEATDTGAEIKQYLGSGDCCTVPSTLGGLPVRRICAGAFCGQRLTTLILPPELEILEEGAFVDCEIDRLCFFDTLQKVSDASFTRLPRRIRVNAAAAPVYGTSYFATFADKFDYLLSLKGQRKLVFFAGSSTRYGYDCGRIHRAFPSYSPANMGVYAYTNARQQLELICQAMEPGDVLVHAPEFEPLEKQFCGSTKLEWHFWAMAEADYGLVERLDIACCEGVFDSFAGYQITRQGMIPGTYLDSPNGFDDDGYRRNADTYNQYGDLSMLREGTKIDVMLQHVRADYRPEPFTQNLLDALNGVHQQFLDKGVQVLFSYSPRNRSSLTEKSTPENRQALHKLLKAALRVPVILPIEESLLSGEYFYLIDSHLSSEGARVFTEKIIQALKPWLES